MILLFVSGLEVVILLIVLVLIGPPIVMSIVGLFLLRKKPKTAKVLFIISGIYVLIGAGICGGILN